MSRRHSVVDAYAEVESKIRNTMTELSTLWDEVNMHDSMRLKRVNSAFHHIKQLCDDMVDGEKEMVENLKTSIREDVANVQQMRTELEMEPFEKPPDMRANSIALMRHLQDEVKRLEVEYRERSKQQTELIDKIMGLKNRLDSNFEFEHDIHTLFPVRAMESYTAECNHMDETLRERYRKIENWQSDIKQWMNLCENVATFVRQNEEACYLIQQNIDADDFVFSESSIELFETAHLEIKPMYDNWLEGMEFRWLEKYEELSDLWEKCMIPNEERVFGNRFEPGRHTEEMLDKMSVECERLNKRFNSCKIVYNLVESWMVVWKEKLGIEEKRKQPDYYKKVNVLPDNKRERELLTMLPQLEKEIRAANKKHEEENDGEPVLIHGIPPNEYVKGIKEEHKRELKFELQLKKEEKTRLNSPQPTPNSQKRPNPFRTPKNATPAVKKLNFDPILPSCMSPVTSEAISFITPTRRRQAGPLTSSPKASSSRTTTPLSKMTLSRAITPSSTASRPLSRKN